MASACLPISVPALLAGAHRLSREKLYVDEVYDATPRLLKRAGSQLPEQFGAGRLGGEVADERGGDDAAREQRLGQQRRSGGLQGELRLDRAVAQDVVDDHRDFRKRHIRRWSHR